MTKHVTVFHVDMDAFYASVEQLDHPELRGEPVLVGGDGNRGVVAACSYEARRFGIHSAMPMAEARRRCPAARIVPVRMQRYREMSNTIMGMFADYTPSVQAISVDEAFLDMTGTERLFGAPRGVAQRIKRDVRRETGLTISVGIGPSRFIAKLASDVDKPDGLFEVKPGDEADFVLSLSLKDLWGLGASTRRRLEALGIRSVADLRSQRPETLRGHFGASTGTFLAAVALGEDPGIYSGEGGRHSISAEETFERDIADTEALRHQLILLSDEVFHRSIAEGWRGRTVQVKYRFPPFDTHTASRTLPRQLSSSRELADLAMHLLEDRRGDRPLRLVGVGLSGTREEAPDPQGELFAATEAPPVDPTIVELRRRFGPDAITRASATRGRHGSEP
jgi:DNA polymerase-4